jgi:hypothetical protein
VRVESRSAGKMSSSRETSYQILFPVVFGNRVRSPNSEKSQAASGASSENDFMEGGRAELRLAGAKYTPPFQMRENTPVGSTLSERQDLVKHLPESHVRGCCGTS